MNGQGFAFIFFVVLLAVALWLRGKRLRRMHPERFLPLTWKQRVVLYIIPTMIWFLYHCYIFYPESYNCKFLQTGSFSGLMLLFLPFYYLIFVVPLAFMLPRFVEGNRDMYTKNILKFGLFMYPASMVLAAMTTEYICNVLS